VTSWQRRFRDGAFWVRFWLANLGFVTLWGVATMVFKWFNTTNVVLLSIYALMLACGAGVQASLGMRKADPEDDF